MNSGPKGSDQLVALFENARQVIKANTATSYAGIAVAIKPVPEEYSTECGMCLQFAAVDREKFMHIVTALGFTPQIHDC